MLIISSRDVKTWEGSDNWENTLHCTSVLKGVKFNTYQWGFCFNLGSMAPGGCELFKNLLSLLEGAGWRWGFTVCIVSWRSHAIFRERRVLFKKEKRTTEKNSKVSFDCQLWREKCRKCKDGGVLIPGDWNGCSFQQLLRMRSMEVFTAAFISLHLR